MDIIEKKSNILIKLKNIIIGWYYRFTGVNYELYKTRSKICESCEFRTKIFGDWFCSACGCSIASKTRVESENCKLNKW